MSDYLPIETGTDNKILRTISKPVKDITKKTLKFIKEMEKSMYAKKGVGIAAPQVSENIRLVLVQLDFKQVVPMINPEILSHSDSVTNGEEGCLSLPGWWGHVKRWKEVTVSYLTPKGEKRTIKLTNFNARIMQHEVDHLNAILFADHVDPKDLKFEEKKSRNTEKEKEK